MTSDLDLLEKFARQNSQDAFGEIVRRHLNLVYSAALRQVRSPQLAEEIAQSVFADLARSTAKLKPGTTLTAWLYAVTRRTAIDEIRKESRRQLREQIAVEMNNMNATADEWMQIEPLLDDAMAALDETDRAAVLLRYFENKSLREVGATLGTTDDAAQKRVSRAVERLREFFSKRNVTVGAGGLAILISANAVQSAPVGLAVTISAAVFAGAAVSTSTAIATTKVIAMTTLQKTIIGAALVAVMGTGVFEAHQASQLRGQIQTLQQRLAPLAEQNRQLQRERDDATNRLAGLQVENEQLKSNETELLKLRAEITRLRADSQQLAGLKSGSSENVTESDEAAWLERIRLLKQRLAQTPEAQIPELQYLTEDDWLRAAKHKLETEDDYRAAFSQLDADAEGNFLRIVETGLRKYLDANNGRFPADLPQLKSYFTNAPADELLQRYQIVPADSVPQANLAGDVGNYVITPKYPVNHALWVLSSNGLAGTSDSNSAIMDVLAPALKALLAATPMIDGKREINLHQLPPYLTTPEQRAAYQKLMENIDKK
ncbi:MAG TPA: sigma-70 family RNA polymerase sigma factor [Verrucomicrobiae bacterium]|nr:sigma-70 family RNA polymerase sigma factor [Verrucomicrobiae bacterium]